MKAHRSHHRLLAVIFLVLTWLAVVLAGAVAAGRVGYVITNGVSMNPLYHEGDLVVVAKAESYEVGQIVAYRLPSQHLVVLHRIIGGDASGYVFKGDNNQSTDPTHPPAAQVVGRAVFHLAQGGIWLQRLTSPTGLGLIALVMVAGSGGAVKPRRRRKRSAMPSHATPFPNLSMAALATAPPWLRTAVAGTGTVGVLSITLAALAWTGPVVTAVSSETPATGSMTFSYTSSVPRTVAYDSTLVTSPDPVFRKLANTVQVHYAYDGSPGTVTVVAEVSTASGWHSTVPLAKSTTFTTDRYHGTVRLNLKALEARAQAAGVVTGIPASGVTVAVRPRVDTADGARFAPSLPLSLSPLQLTLPGGAPALVVKDSAAVKQAGTASRTIGALGGHVTVATARVLSMILLLAALLGAAALLFIARRLTPTCEAEGICRRYAALLVPVQPMAVPSGRPVVDVDDFATLARLAERYGLLVMHWRRSHVETFVVQDEGTTYRYRTGVGEATDPVTTVVSSEDSI